MPVLCSSRKPMRKTLVSGFPRALLSLSHAQKRRALGSRLHPKPLIRLPIILQAVLARPRVRGCTFLFVVGKCGPPQPLGWLVPMFCCCHHEDFIGALSFYGEHALAYPQPQFSDMISPETKASPTIFEKCGGKLAREGRGATP